MLRLDFAGIKNAGVVLAALAVTLVAGAGVASAASSNVTIEGTTNHTVYKAGQTITITGTVNGDIFCAGQTVDVDATVNGDVICAGQTVTVDGTVHGSVRLAGENVTIGAHVDRNATVAGQTVILQSNGAIANDAGIMAQTATLDGHVGRDIRVAATTLILNGNTGRNVDATVNTLRLGGHTVIGRNLSYRSPDKLQIPAGASIGGTITYHYRAAHQGKNHIMWRGPGIFVHLYVILSLLIFGMVLVACFPRLFEAVNRRAGSRFWVALLAGFIAMFAMPLLIIALLVSVFGVPLAIFIGLLWTVAVFLSAPLSAYYVGRSILGGEGRSPLVMLVGSLVLGLVTLIPVIGWLVTLVALWFGTGSVLLNLKRLRSMA